MPLDEGSQQQAGGGIPPATSPPLVAKVPLATIVTYSLPAIAFGFSGALVSLYFLKFATDVLLIAPASVGLAFSLSRFWDAFSDPIVGFLSDRTRSRLGRRRPWLLYGAVPFALISVALWSPPAALTGQGLALWVGVTVVLFYTAFTIVGVPHSALGAELTDDYHDRARVFGGRGFIEFFGLLLAGAGMWLLEASDDERGAARTLLSLFGVLAVVLMVGSAARIRERPEYLGRGAESPIAAMRDILANPHARLLLAVLFLETLGFAFLTTLFPYMTQYVLGGGIPAGAFLLWVIGISIVTFPVWIPLSRRFGKRNPWIAAQVVKAASFGVMYFADPADTWIAVLTAGAIGTVQGAGIILGPAIKADVIDYDEAVTGERKEGAYFAGWSFAQKSAAGTAILLTGFALQAVGYEPNVEQGETSLRALRALFAGIPCALHLVTVVLLLRFTLNQEEHAEIRRRIDH